MAEETNCWHFLDLFSAAATHTVVQHGVFSKRLWRVVFTSVEEEEPQM